MYGYQRLKDMREDADKKAAICRSQMPPYPSFLQTLSLSRRWG